MSFDEVCILKKSPVSVQENVKVYKQFRNVGDEDERRQEKGHKSICSF